jgi:hypothetical protein
MKINLDPKVNLERDDIIIVVDTICIKVTNRGEWMLDKWKKKRKKKGFIKIHVAVNIKTKKIRSNNIQKVLTYGDCNSKYNFRYLDILKITPIIKVRKNLSIRNNANCILRE